MSKWEKMSKAKPLKLLQWHSRMLARKARGVVRLRSDSETYRLNGGLGR